MAFTEGGNRPVFSNSPQAEVTPGAYGGGADVRRLNPAQLPGGPPLGLDDGPIRLHEKMRSLGMDAPSVASLVRILRDAVVVAGGAVEEAAGVESAVHVSGGERVLATVRDRVVLAGGRKCLPRNLSTTAHSPKSGESRGEWQEEDDQDRADDVEADAGLIIR